MEFDADADDYVVRPAKPGADGAFDEPAAEPGEERRR
jgi:hypothetical protein